MLRRSFLKGISALFIAPAIIKAENLMPIKVYMPSVPSWCPDGWLPLDGREISKKFYPELYAVLQKLRQPLVLPNFYATQSYKDVTPYSSFAEILDIRNVISYKKLVRPNGSVMLPGALHPIYVPEGAA